MGFVTARRAVLLVPSPPAWSVNDTLHPHVAITDGADIDGYRKDSLILVSLSSVKPDGRHDTTCVLPAGCHAAIRVESFARYDKTQFVPSAHIQEGIVSGRFIARDPIQDDWCRLLEDGILASDKTPLYLKKIYAEIVGIKL
jgi:hypothetical protein